MKFNNKNVSISPLAKIGINVRIGDNTVIYDHVEIKDNTIICNDCVIGEPLNAYYLNENYRNPTTSIGEGSLIRSHAIIYAGCIIGKSFITGHRITIRENTRIGDSCLVGTMCDLQGELTIGSFCRLYSNVHIAQNSQLGNYVFMYPFSVMANDPYPPSNKVKGGCIGDYTQVGVHSVILPKVNIGENCLIGANSVVNKKLEDFSFAIGDPAKILMDVRKFVVLGEGRPYPWMTRFDRGMPWEGIGYELWITQGKQ
jgi:acetyltransferase-like isoleucine patch superfamily enzyme